jgi:hypothetical protein
MLVGRLIPSMETLLLTFKDISLRRRGFGMFEEMASDAVKMLILFFWTTLGFAVIWGALWLKASRKAK